MFLFGKNQEDNMTSAANASDTSLKHELEGLRAIGEYALKQKHLLQHEEIKTSDELKGIQYSFDMVRQKSEDISTSVTDFQAQFSRVQEIVDRFESIISKMEATVEESHNSMNMVSSTVADSTVYYDKVDSDIQNMMTNITKKGFVFEDLNNALEQIDPMIRKIRR